MTCPNYLIRPTKIEDKKAVNKAHVRSIREICSNDYRPEQIKAWSAVRYNDVIWKQSVENDALECFDMEFVI